MTTVKRRREVMLGAVLLQQQRWSFEELLFLPKYFRKNHFIARTLYVHETFSTESYCSWRSLLQHLWIIVTGSYILETIVLKLANRSRKTITTFSAAPRLHCRYSCGKLFFPRHERNLYSCYWLGSSLVPGNLISDEIIKFREGLFFETDSQLYVVETVWLDLLVRTVSFFWKRMHWLNQPKNWFNEVPHCPSSRKTHLV